MTFFDKHTASFETAKIIDGKVETKPFLDAAQVLVTLLEDSLGSAFAPVRSDIQGNINKTLEAYNKNPSAAQTLQDIVIAEKKESKKPTTDAILWLKRALEFTCLALRYNLDTPTEELSASFSRAYSSTLSKYHSFLVRPVFTLAMNACPKRANFYESLAEGETEKLVKQLDQWVKGLEVKLKIVVDFYVAEKLN